MFSALIGISLVAAKPTYFAPPSLNLPARVVPGGITILPNGRFLTPAGRRLWSGEDLWGLALSPDGKTVIGIHTESAGAASPSPGITVYGEDGRRKDVPMKDIAPAAAFTADGSRLIVSNGEKGGIRVLRTADWSVEKEIVANEGEIEDSYINDIVVGRSGEYAYTVDVANQQVVVFDLKAGTVAGRTKAGREPYACVLAEDEKSLFVANIGVFDYSLVPKPKAGSAGDPRGLHLPAFAFPTKESEKGVEKEGRFVPGLGSPYVADAQSVWSFDISTPRSPKLKSTAKSGILIHGVTDAGKAVGASAPNELLLHKGELYVANANNDTISVFDPSRLKLKRTIKLSPHPAVALLRGVIPSGMAMNRDGSRLYVCASGLNAVAVVNPVSGKTLGYIPSGWFPMEVRLSPDSKTLYVATQKGLGRGPRGLKNPRTKDDERFGLTEMPGMIQAVAAPSKRDLERGTREVLRNNGLLTVTPAPPAVAGSIGRPSDKIKHVVFITKENHTFDGIFGADVPGANGEPDYAEFGLSGWLSERGKAERIPIMPNHIALARQFGISDNFYMEPQASGDGHRWLVGVYPSLWTTRVFYAGWNFKATDKAKGRLVSFGSDGSQIPEDYLENGSLFEHLNRGGVTMRNYGEGYELPETDEAADAPKSGTIYPFNHPMPKVLFDHTCFEFPAYNNNIPDIARHKWFEEDLQKTYFSKGKGLPAFLNIAICNDHGARPNAKLGYPYVASYMADNDLALGRIVEFLSHRPEWKSTVIFVTQDDSGADNDHVDRHRSFVMAIGPWVKRGYVSHRHTSIMSIIRSIYQIYGLGPNNMFDALAADLSDMLTDKPNFTPYTHIPSDPRVFKPEATLPHTSPELQELRKQVGPVKMDDPDFMEWLRNRSGG